MRTKIYIKDGMAEQKDEEPGSQIESYCSTSHGLNHFRLLVIRDKGASTCLSQ